MAVTHFFVDSRGNVNSDAFALSGFKIPPGTKSNEENHNILDTSKYKSTRITRKCSATLVDREKRVEC